MKLINKVTLWYLAITLFILLVGGVLVFYSVQQRITQDNKRILAAAVSYTAGNLQKGLPVEPLPNIQMVVNYLPVQAPQIPLHFIDTTVWYPPHQHNELALYASSSYKFNNKHYLITASSFITESDDIISGVKRSLVWIFAALLIFIVVCNRLISRQLFAPFHKTLDSIETFNLHEQRAIHFPESTTEEFRQLNQFLQQMIKKSVSDYKALKEFTENASHELRTPLAVIRGKLELLMESKIDEEQAALLAAAHSSIQHLAAIHESLTLLTKLENKEYAATTTVNLSQMLQTMLDEFKELAQMKNITIEHQIEGDVLMPINESLARILIANLLSNSIRHNYEHGKIWIETIRSFTRGIQYWCSTTSASGTAISKV
jgi:signal transduction histidine kinase